MTTRDDIVAAARRWMGTPYHHGARLHGAGVDCAQLLVAVFVDDLGLVAPFDIADYPPDWMMHRSGEIFLGHIMAHATEVTEPLPGDIVLYKWGHCFAHGAIVTSWPLMIHADITRGKVTESEGNMGRFDGREHKFFRVEGI